MKRQNLEVVAPAGKRSVLPAAVCNGADAVYFGLGDFNARRRAENFQLEELPEVVAWLHRRNVKAYITLNTLLFSDELAEARKYIAAMARAGADAVIVQDLGVARMAKAIAPGLKVHASTQMSLTEAGGIELVRRELGIERVVLARELSIEQIRQIRGKTDIELEVFVHGAMCISYSGQCLGSLLMLDRSANRGVCAQPCRMVYDVLAGGKVVGTKGRYVLSPRDLAAYEHVKDLADAGVAALKIEGRMKNEYYVAAATAVYRRCADAAAAGKTVQITEDEKELLLQTFSRGFSSGFLKGKDHQGLVHAQFGKNRGVLVGEVIETAYSGQRTADRKSHAAAPTVCVKIADEHKGRAILKAGDGVVIEDGENEQGGRLYVVREAGSNVELAFGRGDVDLAQVREGARVWKTDDPQAKKRLEATWARDDGYRREKVAVRVWARVGEKLRIEMSDTAGDVVVVEGDRPLEAAMTRAATEGLLREQLGRLGGTPFELGDLKVEAMDAVMVPLSILNALRREAVEKLIDQREIRSSKHEIRNNIEILNTEKLETEEPQSSGLSAVVRSLWQAQAVGMWKGLSRVYGEFGVKDESRAFLAWAKDRGLSAGLVTPQVITPGDEWVLDEILGCGPDAVLVRNLAAVAYFRGKGVEMVADASLNVVNEVAADVLRGWGVACVTIARDAGAAELRAMVARSSAAWYEAVVYGHTAMFHMEHCIAAANLSDEKDRKGCGRPCDSGLELRDLKGRRYRVGTDRLCRNTVYAAGAWRESEYIDAVRAAGVRSIRVELRDETPSLIADCYTRLETVLH